MCLCLWCGVPLCLCVCVCVGVDWRVEKRKATGDAADVCFKNDRTRACSLCVCMPVWLSVCLSAYQPSCYSFCVCLFLSRFQLQLLLSFYSPSPSPSSLCLHTVALSNSVLLLPTPSSIHPSLIHIYIHIHSPSSTSLQRPPLLQVHISCTRFARSCMVPLDLAAPLLACALTST